MSDNDTDQEKIILERDMQKSCVRKGSRTLTVIEKMTNWLKKE